MTRVVLVCSLLVPAVSAETIYQGSGELGTVLLGVTGFPWPDIRPTYDFTVTLNGTQSATIDYNFSFDDDIIFRPGIGLKDITLETDMEPFEVDLNPFGTENTWETSTWPETPILFEGTYYNGEFENTVSFTATAEKEIFHHWSIDDETLCISVFGSPISYSRLPQVIEVEPGLTMTNMGLRYSLDDSLILNAVPEPSGFLMAMAGLAVFLLAFRVVS